MTKTYNPYKQALSLLTEQLNLNNIPIVTNKKSDDTKVFSIPEMGFDVDVFKQYLIDTEISSFKPKRTIKQYSTYEVLQCLRKSYYLRQGADADMSKIGQYPFGKIKAIMGTVVEKLLLSMYNQCKATKFTTDVYIKWYTNKDLGLLYPLVGVIDGLSYDTESLLDVKYTDQFDEFHVNQVKLYALAYKNIKKRKTPWFNFGEIVYINTALNSITVKRIDLDNDTIHKDWEQLIDRMKYYDNCLRNKTLPKAELNGCIFCPYEHLCKSNDKTSMTGLNNQVSTNSIETKDNSHRGEKKNNMYTQKQKSNKEIQGDEIKVSNHPKHKSSNLKILL